MENLFLPEGLVGLEDLHAYTLTSLPYNSTLPFYHLVSQESDLFQFILLDATNFLDVYSREQLSEIDDLFGKESRIFWITKIHSEAITLNLQAPFIKKNEQAWQPILSDFTLPLRYPLKGLTLPVASEHRLAAV